METVAAEKDKTELGKWIFSKAEARGFGRRIDFIHAMKMSQSSVYAWTSLAKLAVPDRRALQELDRVLRLNREEREELRELVLAQERAAAARSEEQAEAPAPESAAPLALPAAHPMQPAPERWVEPIPRYMNLEVAVRRAAEAGKPYPEHAVRAASILMRRDYDPVPEEWAQLIELEAAVAERFERREQIVLEHEVAAPDLALLASNRKR